MAKLKQQQRNKLATSEFALPKKRGYPIHDENHARLALAMASKHASRQEQKQIQAAVHKRYPNIGQHGMKQPKKKSSRPYFN